MTVRRHRFLRSNLYDHLDRRVQKLTPEATHTYFYDGWLLIKEVIANTNGTTDVVEYHWGKDHSGTIGGAGGVGGLFYIAVSNSSTPNSSTRQLYIPWHDAYGNVMGYWDAQGSVVAEYTYDAFGKLISSSGPMTDAFAFRCSTKYFDSETGFYYYGYRCYSPELMRWLTRDPIGEEGGVNLYCFCGNNALNRFDADGCAYFAYRPLASPLFRHFIMGNRQDAQDSTMVAHEQLFFEDGGIPTNLGYFDDNTVRIDTSGIAYKKPHSIGWNDCIMRNAVGMVKPRKYKLLDIGMHNLRSQYNCQDWAKDVRWAYYCLTHNIHYYPQGTTFIGSKP